jgi:6-methylsalicylate decarboxylase
VASLIDVHHHILPPRYLAVLGDRLGPQGLLGPPPKWSPAISIETMDRHGIQTAVTSISAPGVWFGDPDECRGLARACNEYAAEMKRDFPGRFESFAVLPLPEIDLSLREIEYAFDTARAKGVGLLTNYGGRYPGDPAFAPVFDELNARKAVVFFHPIAAAYGVCLPEIPVPTLEFPFETTRAIVSLLNAGGFGRWRDIKFVFSHAGGAVPFLAERIARLKVRPEFRERVPDGAVVELARLYYDVALSANHFAFDPLRRLAGMGHIVFGSDFPHAGEPTLAATASGIRNLGLSESDMRSIESTNAAALLSC